MCWWHKSPHHIDVGATGMGQTGERGNERGREGAGRGEERGSEEERGRDRGERGNERRVRANNRDRLREGEGRRRREGAVILRCNWADTSGQTPNPPPPPPQHLLGPTPLGVYYPHSRDGHVGIRWSKIPRALRMHALMHVHRAYISPLRRSDLPFATQTYTLPKLYALDTWDLSSVIWHWQSAS